MEEHVKSARTGCQGLTMHGMGELVGEMWLNGVTNGG